MYDIQKFMELFCHIPKPASGSVLYTLELHGERFFADCFSANNLLNCVTFP